MKFKNKIVLVTGAGSGIGRGTALAFAREGATVVVSDINETGGHETVEMIGQAAVFVKADVSDPEQVESLIQQIVVKYNRLDIAINNAGVGGVMGKIHEMPLHHYKKVMNINLDGVFYCLQHELRQMLGQGSGCIVNVASVAGLRPLPNSAAYSASKHAVVGLTKTAALEYARKNIRINAVCPVFTHSAMVQGMFDVAPELEQKLLRTIPMGRYGQPEDVAQAILWLCSDENNFLTGHALPIDGGGAAV
jgi:NAD(P)-dependent dehydrogenase (short-subunit alcohol dehydrogenase family)